MAAGTVLAVLGKTVASGYGSLHLLVSILLRTEEHATREVVRSPAKARYAV
jgi:hypothetical protein